MTGVQTCALPISNLSLSEQIIFISMFHTGWYLVSLWTQTLVLYTLRTQKMPFIESNPSRPMLLVTLLAIFVGTAIPYTKLGNALHFMPMPVEFWYYLLAVVFLYLLLTTIIKKIYIKKYKKLI